MVWPPPLLDAALGSDGARARFGAPPLDAARRSTWEPRGSFLLAEAALQALDGTRARFGAPCLDAARRSTWQPRGSFLLAGAALQALDGTRARFGAPLDAALGSLAAGFCWQAQHFRLWTVQQRVSGPPPPLMLPGAALGLAPPLLDAARRSTWEPRGSFLLAETALQALCQAQHLAASRLVSAGTTSTSGSARYPSAFRGPPLDAARRSTWQPRGSLAGAALQALDGTRARS